MSAKLPGPVLAKTCLESQPIFGVVLVYEDFAAGRRAMDAYNSLLSNFGREFQFRLSMWKFDILRDAAMSGMATHDAIEAKAIIIATHQCSELPDAVRNWINTWLPEKPGQGAALVGLLDCEPAGRTCGIETYLKNVAELAGMNFLLRRFDTPNGKAPSSRGGSPRKPSSLDSSSETRPREGWGLND